MNTWRTSRLLLWCLIGALMCGGGCETPDAKRRKARWNQRAPTSLPPRLESTVVPTAPQPVEREVVVPPPTNDPELGIEQLLELARVAERPAGEKAIPERRYSFSAKDLALKDALALFARSNELNIVPDQDVEGSITVDFRDLPLSKAMEALLETFGYYATVDRGLIRVRVLKTAHFTVDYIRLIRGGTGNSTANIASGSGATGADAGKEVANISITQNDSIKFWDMPSH